VVVREEHGGRAAAYNRGIAAATGAYVAMLKPDIIVAPGVLGGLVRALAADTTIGLVGPTRFEPGPVVRPADLTWLGMSCVAFRRGLIEEIGSLDERFGDGAFVDDDLVVRVRRAGGRIVCLDELTVQRVGGDERDDAGPSGRDELLERGRARFEEKWGTALPPQQTEPRLPPRRPSPGDTPAASDEPRQAETWLQATTMAAAAIWKRERRIRLLEQQIAAMPRSPGADLQIVRDKANARAEALEAAIVERDRRIRQLKAALRRRSVRGILGAGWRRAGAVVLAVTRGRSGTL
jgi:hypothetical protein